MGGHFGVLRPIGDREKPVLIGLPIGLQYKEFGNKVELSTVTIRLQVGRSCSTCRCSGRGRRFERCFQGPEA